MSVQTRWIVLCIASALVSGSIVYVNAGSLTPPPGAVQPTMRTLDEIYGATATCVKCVWTSKYVDSGTPIEILPPGTHGVLHGAVFQGAVTIWEGQVLPENIVADVGANTGGGTQRVDLNVAFSNGLWIRGSKITIMYVLN